MNQIETLEDILDAWHKAARESDKRALWRALARGGWLQACRTAVQRQDRGALTDWLDEMQTIQQEILQFSGPQAAQTVYTHLACSLAACGENAPPLALAPPGFCRDLRSALLGQPLREAERDLVMTVLLVDTARNEGVVATLTLELLPSGNGELYPNRPCKKSGSGHWQRMVDKMAPEFLEVPGTAAEQGVDPIADLP
jgi:hypothetical protein